MSAEQQEVGVHVYAVVDPARCDLDDLTGLDGTALRMVEHEGVAAVVNDITLERPPGRKAELMTYREVLDTLAASGPVVPVQFGAVLLDDESVVTDVLDGQGEVFGELLESVAGRVQLQLRASYHEDLALTEIVQAQPEVARLREATRGVPEDASYGDRMRLGELVAQAMENKRDLDTQSLMDVVSPHVVDARVTLAGDTDGLARIAMLVDEDRVPALEDELEQLAEAVHERIRLSLVGPMAPYDFVGGA